MAKATQYNATVYRIRRQYQRQTLQNGGKPREAVIGDADGRFAVPNRSGYVYVRELGQRDDATGDVTYGAPQIVQAGLTAGYIPRVGQRVYIGYGINGQLQILSGSFEGMVAQGINPLAINPNAPERQFLKLENATNLLSLPVNTVGTPGLLVTVYPLIYDQDFTLENYAGTVTAAQKIDLTSFVPTGTGTHRVVMLYLRTTDGTIQTVGSVPQPTSEAFDFTDALECDEQRDADTIPIRGYQLLDSTITMTTANLWQDFRQWVNIPEPLGFPSVIRRKRIVRAERKELTYGTITDITNITLQGTLTIL